MPPICGITVAVKMATWPQFEGFVKEVTVVVVVAGEIVNIPEPLLGR
jgi:hypothetical protein